MPNQWVKVVKSNNPASPNIGRVCPVKHGRPALEYGRDEWTGNMAEIPAYTTVNPEKFIVRGPRSLKGSRLHLTASCVELLGPDECARLDAEHGMTGRESES